MKRIGIGLVLALMVTFAQANDEGAVVCNLEKGTRSSAMIEEAIDLWKDTPGGQMFEARSELGEIVLVTGSYIPVSGVVSESGYGQQRKIAFEKSLLDVQTKFVMIRSMKIETEKYASLFSKDPSEAEMQPDEDEQSYLSRIREKVMLLTEAKLDRALREEGVDVKTIEKMEPAKKVQLLQDTISRNTKVTAMSEISGLTPIENFEVVNCLDGTAGVATIAVYSSKMQALAKDIVAGRPIQAEPEAAAVKTIGASIREDIRSKDIMNIYGIRKANDLQGFPIILSYGQWAFVNKGGSNYERTRALAMNMASDNARSELALFLNGTLHHSNQSMFEGTERIEASITEHSRTEEEIREVITSQQSMSQAKAKVTLTGVKEVGSWTIKHPDFPSLVIVGKVLMWSPRTADSIHKATGSSRRQSGALPEEEKKKSVPLQRGRVIKSKSKNDAYNF